MKILFLGAAGTVTGSSYVLTSESGQSILIDLGMFQGTAEIEALNYQPYAYDCSQLSAIILTHAHLDHCGRLPIAVDHGFHGPIFMTPPTREMTELSLLDSAKIAKKEHATRLYDEDLVLATMAAVEEVPYRTPTTIGDFTFTFRDAGHILGSASIEIEDHSATNPASAKKIIFSGDLGNSPADLLEATESLGSADVVVMESTYGDRMHPAEKASDVIQAEINQVEQSGGALLLPAFSLERSQELLHIIMHLKKAARVRANTAVYLDSPMAVAATRIYLKHLSWLNAHARQDEGKGGVFGFPGLFVPRNHEESKQIWEQDGPKVIIAGGGMMTGGRILGHSARYLPDPKNRLLIVGYQGEDTLGRDIQEGARKVTINDQSIAIKANVNSTRAMSSHADQRQLLEWLGAIKGVKKVFLTHGEDGPRSVLKDTIQRTLGINAVEMPQMGEEMEC